MMSLERCVFVERLTVMWSMRTLITCCHNSNVSSAQLLSWHLASHHPHKLALCAGQAFVFHGSYIVNAWLATLWIESPLWNCSVPALDGRGRFSGLLFFKIVPAGISCKIGSNNMKVQLCFSAITRWLNFPSAEFALCRADFDPVDLCQGYSQWRTFCQIKSNHHLHHRPH